MGLFKKNPNETTYQGGVKHWADVIKNTSRGGDLIWRQPEEDFNTNSTLIVMPGEEAIFIKGGNIEEVFTNGTYKLSTENYPFISRLRNAFTGGISTFNCVVYFVRTASSMQIEWGTDTPIQVRDKMLGITTELQANGSYKICVGNSAKFLTKLLGNRINMLSQDDITEYFSDEFLADIKSVIAEYVNNSDKEIIGISQRQREISNALTPILQESLEEYGLKLLKFSIAGLNVADSELRARYDKIEMDAYAKMRNAQADRNVMNMLGSNWQAQQQFDMMNRMAQNQGDMSGAASMGMGLAAGAAFFNMAQSQTQQMTSSVPPAPPMAQYYLYTGGQQVGPVAQSLLPEYVRSGHLNKDTLVWKEGMPDWAAAGTLPALAVLFGAPTPPPPVPSR